MGVTGYLMYFFIYSVLFVVVPFVAVVFVMTCIKFFKSEPAEGLAAECHAMAKGEQ